MALTITSAVDIVGQSQTITFFNPLQVDQISFTNNQITFEAFTSFNLSKSDLLLYIQYKVAFYNQLFINFPSINQYVNQTLPLSNFQISNTFAGVTHITYNQTSSGNTAVNINYVPTAQAASFTGLASPVTITMQEFFMNIYMLQSFYQQILVN